tara:strand:+ start:67 stop:636 length:570 start_codon:yes stop_codon:yes gene_type:complete
MKFLKKNCIIKIAFLIIIMFSFTNQSNANYDKLIYDFKIETINGKILDFSEYKNKPILLVNVASKCGFTNQYGDLQKLWEMYKEKGLLVVGLPSNDFGNQEPGSESEIKKFCETNFNIDFPITKKIKVKGQDTAPLYSWAYKNYGKAAIPKWNFYKILINKDGKIEKTFSSLTNPLSKKLVENIEKILN